tara:strand:- start:1295 stop:1573 length:279 start_codon:yes stop_codon:yes gene_type:complete
LEINKKTSEHIIIYNKISFIMATATHSARGIHLQGYKHIKSLSAANWAKADPERRRKQQQLYYTQNAEKIKARRRALYQEKKIARLSANNIQ